MTSAAASIRIAPTLATMAEMYRLSREGGPRSERFRAYVARVEHEWGIVAYNPMAGEPALHAVQRLIDLDAESLAAEDAKAVAERCEYGDGITLALVVRSRGMWTDRVATEIELRASPITTPAGHGMVTLWAGEPADESLVRRETIAETVRVMSTARHGSARTLVEILWREGLACALAAHLVPFTEVEAASIPADSLWAPASEADALAVSTAIEVLGDSASLGDIASVLLGDPAAETMGWPAMGVPNRAGYRWAIRHAERVLGMSGAAAALRASPPMSNALRASP